MPESSVWVVTGGKEFEMWAASNRKWQAASYADQLSTSNGEAMYVVEVPLTTYAEGEHPDGDDLGTPTGTVHFLDAGAGD